MYVFKPIHSTFLPISFLPCSYQVRQLTDLARTRVQEVNKETPTGIPQKGSHYLWFDLFNIFIIIFVISVRLIRRNKIQETRFKRQGTRNKMQETSYKVFIAVTLIAIL